MQSATGGHADTQADRGLERFDMRLEVEADPGEKGPWALCQGGVQESNPLVYQGRGVAAAGVWPCLMWVVGV